MRYRTRATLVVLQIALSGVLLIGAGLLARAFVAVQRVDTGFDRSTPDVPRRAPREPLSGNTRLSPPPASCSAAWRRFPV